MILDRKKPAHDIAYKRVQVLLKNIISNLVNNFFTYYDGRDLWIFSKARFKIIRIFLLTTERDRERETREREEGEGEKEMEAQYIITQSLGVIWISLNAHFAFSISRHLVQKFHKCFTFNSRSLFPSFYVTFFPSKLKLLSFVLLWTSSNLVSVCQLYASSCLLSVINNQPAENQV